MRRQLSRLLSGVLALTVCACDVAPDTQEAQVPSTPEGQALLSDVSGAWRLVGTTTDDCPPEASVPFPLGDTRWTDEGDSLVISGLGADLTVLSKEQADDIGVEIEGPYKPGHYRY